MTVASHMPTAVASSAVRAGPNVRQLSALQLTSLGLTPGAVGTLVYAALAPVVIGAGYPPVAALLIAIVIAIIPIEVGALLIARRISQRRGEPLIAYTDGIPWRTVAWLIPLLVLAAVAGSVLLTPADVAIQKYLFGGLPGWFRNPLDVTAVASYSRAALIATLGAYMVLNGVVGPVVEEVYFRGWLLPRMEAMGAGRRCSTLACSASTTSGCRGDSSRESLL